MENKPFLFILLSLLISIVLYFGNFKTTSSVPKIKFDIGDTLLIDNTFDKEDPFVETDIDTIKVLDVKNGYIKYQNINDDYQLSRKVKYFIDKVIPNEKIKIK